MNIFGGDLAHIRRMTRQLRMNLIKSTQQTETTMDYAIHYSNPETAKRLKHAWEAHQTELANVQAELKRLTELVELIEKKNHIQYES